MTLRPLDMAGHEPDDDLDLLLVPPPFAQMEIIVIIAGFAASAVAGFFLGLLTEGCIVGVCA